MEARSSQRLTRLAFSSRCPSSSAHQGYGVGPLAGLPHYKTNFPNFPNAAWPPAGVPSELSAILQQCLELDPKCRISASGVRTILMDSTRMRVIVEKREGGQGSATILEQCVERRLLTFLQEDPD